MKLHKDAKIQAIKVFNNIEFRCNEKHNNKYTYDNFVYLTQHTPSLITCDIHGDFNQTLANHLNGKGCPKCAKNLSGNSQRLTIDEFINRSTLLHNKYDYSKTLYNNYYTPVIITCPYHGDFIQKPSEHLAGNGCQICGEITKRKKYLNKPTRLYYIKIVTTDDKILYKIGITTKTVNERYYTESSTGCSIQVLYEIFYSTGKQAYEEEQKILKQFSEYKYKGPSVFIKGGNSELFIKDILGYN